MEKNIRIVRNKFSTLKKSSLKAQASTDDEMALSEHIEEFSQRLIFCLIILLISTLFCFTDIKDIVKIFQAPAIGVKFLQFSLVIFLLDRIFDY